MSEKIICDCGHPMSIHRTKSQYDKANVYSFACRNAFCLCMVVRKE